MLTSVNYYDIIPLMRTTLTLDDDVFHEVRAYAETRSLAVGKAVSELVRRGLRIPTPTRKVNGLIVFDIPRSSHPVTSKRVKQLESEL
jgi:Arc/MetJ family transcription regulator